MRPAPVRWLVLAFSLALVPVAAAQTPITDVSRVVFAYFERLARSNAYGARVP